MANRLLPKRNITTAGKVPVSSDLQTAELAINAVDGIVYSKTTGGTVIAINPPMYNVRTQTTGTTGQFTVAFPTGKFTSVPVVTLTVECPAADAGSYVYGAELVGPATATGCTVKVYRIPMTISILLLGTVTIAGPAPAGVFVNVSAETAT